MVQFEVNTTYEPFSKEREYTEANREFLAGLDIKKDSHVLDLACGTGTMSDLLLQFQSESKVVGLDISRESLLLAQDYFRNKGSLGGKHQHLISFIEGTADCLPFKMQSFDVVIMGNSIHLLADEMMLLAEIHSVLMPKGIFAFNSSFYAGTIPKGTERFHHEWLKLALNYIGEKDREQKKLGLSGIRRKRGTARKAFSKKWLSKEDWIKILSNQGFTLMNVFERTVLMNQRCFETIGAYAGLASVLFSGYPVDLASEALQATARPALAAVNMDVVPRYWLEVIALRN
jgi:ubiquinone/menaquinone biosynthesis C-methylase UbiE